MAATSKGYWSGETLQKRLPALISPPGKYDSERIDCASYRLSIGTQIYVSPTAGSSDPQSVSVRELKAGAAFTVPAGQFALLTTDEIVEIPPDAIGFISIRAKTKFKGLVNVSGFHVDPGFKGQLTFSVFNAGPLPIHLRQGQQIFVLWYSYLDQKTSILKREPVRLGLDVELLQGISGELESFASLSNKLRVLESDLRERVHTVEREQQFYRSVLIWAIPLLVAAAVGVTSWLLRDPPKDQQVNASVAIVPSPRISEPENSSGADLNVVNAMEGNSQR